MPESAHSAECALCPARAVAGARLRFEAVERVEQRAPTRVRLDAPLCQRCANRLYKHLKRVIPKRRFEVSL